jgi:hypothetical protein
MRISAWNNFDPALPPFGLWLYLPRRRRLSLLGPINRVLLPGGTLSEAVS